MRIFANTIRFYSKQVEKIKPPWNILFFGTDNFSLASLKALNYVYRDNYIIDRLEIVTTTRGKLNPIAKYANEENLKVHSWPINTIVGFHIGMVVSFGYLIPKTVIQSFPLGLLNVHASLLPRWRGAAPIIHAIANGDCTTGITIMKIAPKHFDIGDIVDQEAVDIKDDTTMPDLYITLADLGAEMLVAQLFKMPDCLLSAKPQQEVGVTLAPKITSSFGIIRWSTMNARDIYNLSRALMGLYPLLTRWNDLQLKLYDVKLSNSEKSQVFTPGFVYYNKKSQLLKVQCIDGNWISIGQVGVPNKKTMNSCDFNNGYLKKVDLHMRIFK